MSALALRPYLSVLGPLLALLGACTSPKPTLRDPAPREIEAMRYRLAEELVARRDYQSAAPHLRMLLEKHPNHPRLHLLLGKVLREKGVLTAAERELRKAVALAPGDPETHAALAVLLAKQRHLKAAEQSHRRALALAPDQARFHNDLGVCLLAQRRLPEARVALERALQIDPSLRRAFNNLGFVLGLMGDMKGALKAFQQGGGRAMAFTNLGVVSELRGQPAMARRHYERALREQRDFAPARRNLRALDPGHEPSSQPSGS